jgi:hypothetical protein
MTRDYPCRVHKKRLVECKKIHVFHEIFSRFFPVKPRVPILGKENLYNLVFVGIFYYSLHGIKKK